MSPWMYLKGNSGEIIRLTFEHLYIVGVSLLIGTVIAMTIALLTYRSAWASNLATRTTSLILTIPSFALYAVLLGVLGLGVLPPLFALTLYSLLPIVRNTVVGLNEVDDAVVESAKGMGMSRLQQLRRIELPLAWPVVLTGIRVSAKLLIGIAAIAAIVNGPGLGNLIMDALARVGTPIAIPEVIVGTVGIVLIAIIVDAGFAGLTKATTPRGMK